MDIPPKIPRKQRRPINQHERIDPDLRLKIPWFPTNLPNEPRVCKCPTVSHPLILLQLLHDGDGPQDHRQVLDSLTPDPQLRKRKSQHFCKWTLVH